MRRAAALLAVLVLAATGCGGDERGPGGLGWVGTPKLLVAGAAPDRVLQGVIRNDTLRPIEVLAADVRVLDADGDRIKAEVLFAAGLSKPLYPVDRPGEIAEYDFKRLGRKLSLKPGEQVPLTVAWRAPDQPVQIGYGAGTIEIGTPDTVTGS